VRHEDGYGILPSAWFVGETSKTCVTSGTSWSGLSGLFCSSG